MTLLTSNQTTQTSPSPPTPKRPSRPVGFQHSSLPPPSPPLLPSSPLLPPGTQRRALPKTQPNNLSPPDIALHTRSRRLAVRLFPWHLPRRSTTHNNCHIYFHPQLRIQLQCPFRLRLSLEQGERKAVVVRVLANHALRLRPAPARLRLRP